MKNDNSNLLGKVHGWLEKQGYPLEMLVARAFNNSDFYVKMSDFYTDFETGKPREIDVTAQYFTEAFSSLPVLLQVSFHIECKSSPDKPWILFASDTSKDEIGLGYERFISSNIYQTFLTGMLSQSNRHLFYPKLEKFVSIIPQNVGYGITQAFTNGQDITFQALTSALKSAVSRIELFNASSKITEKKYQCAIAFPVVVVDGTLLEGKIDKNGKIQLAEIDSGMLHWKFPNPTRSSPLVSIITKSSLENYAKNASSAAKNLIGLASEFMPQLFEIAEGLSHNESPLFRGIR